MEATVQLDQAGQLSLPVSLRRAMRLEPGDYVKLTMVDDSLLLTPKVLVDKSQAYFWTETWQVGERQADADIAAGHVKAFSSVDALIADLEVG
jgi:AbrB family looped-hinge helix DNA binding protein